MAKTDEAIHWYKVALRATPNDAAKHANLGYALDAAARFKEAAVSFTCVVDEHEMVMR